MAKPQSANRMHPTARFTAGRRHERAGRHAEATFESYDAQVAAGEDTEFGKKLFLQSLSAPYYAMKHFPYRYKTHGGMKITTDSQLTDKDGNPIPNVYCAGSTVADSGSDLSPNAAAASSPAKP